MSWKRSGTTVRKSLVIFCVLLSLTTACTAGGEDQAIAEEVPVSRISDLMATSREEASKRNAVRVVGTISSVGEGIASSRYEMSHRNYICVEDDSGGIWVRLNQSMREGLLEDSENVLPKLRYGVSVEMTGLLDQGGFAPVILPSRIVVLGKGELADPEETILRNFIRGAEDIHRVKVRGVVQSIFGESKRWWLLRVETGVGHFLTRLPKKDAYTPDRLLDAEVELTGLAAASRNWRSEFVCPRLIINSEKDVVIRKEAPSDPFSAEKVALDQLDGYTPGGRPLHRRLITGVVTYSDRDLLYIQHGDTGIRVQLNQPESIEIGESVEVSGFIDNTRHLAGLQGALVRKLGPSETAAPILADLSEILEELQSVRWLVSSNKVCDGRLVQLTGTLLSFQVGIGSNSHRLDIDCGDSITTAFLSAGTRKISPGTKVSLTGVAHMSFETPDQFSNFAMPTRLDLYLRDSSDIVVLSRPPWWTTPRALTALLVVAGLALATFAWAFTLRRTLRQRTDQLAVEMRSRRDAAIEFQGAIRERTRLAANLHDTVLQTMTGVAYQIEACGQSKSSQAGGDVDHLETARRMIQHGQDDLRNTVWALHTLPLPQGNFSDSVQQAADRICLGHDTKFFIETSDNFPALADFIAGNLLLVVQEAIHNSIKYADAKRIDVQMGVIDGGERVHISIKDNGAGFQMSGRPTSSDGHFGIEGMIQRIERLGGQLLIESRPGKGTVLTAEVPLREFDPQIA